MKHTPACLFFHFEARLSGLREQSTALNEGETRSTWVETWPGGVRSADSILPSLQSLPPYHRTTLESSSSSSVTHSLTHSLTHPLTRTPTSRPLLLDDAILDRHPAQQSSTTSHGRRGRRTSTNNLGEIVVPLKFRDRHAETCRTTPRPQSLLDPTTIPPSPLDPPPPSPAPNKDTDTVNSPHRPSPTMPALVRGIALRVHEWFARPMRSG